MTTPKNKRPILRNLSIIRKLLVVFKCYRLSVLPSHIANKAKEAFFLTQRLRVIVRMYMYMKDYSNINVYTFRAQSNKLHNRRISGYFYM